MQQSMTGMNEIEKG